jgi:hypothetical protein
VFLPVDFNPPLTMGVDGGGIGFIGLEFHEAIKLECCSVCVSGLNRPEIVVKL